MSLRVVRIGNVNDGGLPTPVGQPVVIGDIVGNSLDIVVAGDNPAELTDMAARNFVKTAAIQNGFPARGLDRVPSPYPVDKAGVCDGDLLLARPRKGGPVVEYRAEYRLSAGA